MARRDIHPKGGEAYAHPITFVDKATGLPMDVTTWTFRAQVKDAPEGPVIQAADFDVSSAASGVILLKFTKAQADDLAARYDENRPGVYDLEVTRAGNPWTYMAGLVIPEADVTR